MIKIEKIYIENFKGIKDKVIFDFNNTDYSINVLSGPNGFGKTTIFEVIEICLTGNFNRIEQFENVQQHKSNRKKPFFQNTDDEDVIIKLCLYDTNSEEYSIITKHYDDINSPKKKNKGKDFIPVDSKNIFSTYFSTDIDDFENNDFSSLTAVDQEYINQLIYGQDTEIDLSSVYYLFNYIQQEDNIYFLRQKEEDKGKSLSFLFNISKEEDEKNKITIIANQLFSQKTSLNQEIELLQSSLSDNSDVVFERLFDQKKYDFDQKVVFNGDSVETAKVKFESFIDNLNNLINVKRNFSVDEYDKSLKYKFINQRILGDHNLLHAFLIKNVYTLDLNTKLASNNSKVNNAKRFLELKPNELIDKAYFDLFIKDEVKYEDYLVLEQAIIKLNKDLGTIGKLLADFNSERNLLNERFDYVIKSNHISNTNCPLCNSEFTSHEELQIAITVKTDLIKEFDKAKLEEKAKLEDDLKKYHEILKEKVELFLKEHFIYDQSILTIIREQDAYLANIETYVTKINGLNTDSFNDLLFKDVPYSYEELEPKRESLKKYIIDNILEQFKYQEELITDKAVYIEYFQNKERFDSISIELLENKKIYIKDELNKILNQRLTFLRNRFSKIETLLFKIEPIKKSLSDIIKEHKREMIEKIKIPFYVYSGKILQSYQQGLGIFIDINTTGLSNLVTFKTGNSSDHDIVYHLSSGQMAVVSLAFCLSLNKVYNTNDHFKFLSIDDPVQTMDDLNVHTFIELIRNEFQEYQIIMSTHDDFTSRYMKYKFDKFNLKTQILNVQDVVIESSN
ncbi:AAA family ATPase [Myroides odoratimimus]|uniref:AAA family ATPase n=1 Tax=Myroides odoratimimus TaxID=76832 RepID=UPI0025763804|nr:AAA family ATPase [Myroides odoratimimus]MDM1484318.1 AAA family ATPase [Myroides odoratimimus]